MDAALKGYGMQTFHNHRDDHRGDRKSVSDETKMGIVLLVVALIAFAGYAGILLISFLLDMLHR